MSLTIVVWKEKNGPKPWTATVMNGQDEVWAKRFDDLDDALYAASSAYMDVEDAGDLVCFACDGTGEGLFGGISGHSVCSECGGTGAPRRPKADADG